VNEHCANCISTLSFHIQNVLNHVPDRSFRLISRRRRENGQRSVRHGYYTALSCDVIHDVFVYVYICKSCNDLVRDQSLLSSADVVCCVALMQFDSSLIAPETLTTLHDQVTNHDCISSSLFVFDEYCASSARLQCFDTVGWASGRASGL